MFVHRIQKLTVQPDEDGAVFAKELYRVFSSTTNKRRADIDVTYIKSLPKGLKWDALIKQKSPLALTEKENLDVFVMDQIGSYEDLDVAESWP